MNPLEQIREVKQEIALMLTQLRQVDDFKIDERITKYIDDMASHVGNNEIKKALDAGNAALHAGRNIFTAFLRGSVVDQISEIGDQPDRFARFNRIISDMEIEGYGDNMLNRIKTRRRGMLEAVREEEGPDFSRRVAAYLELATAADEAREEHERLKQKRQAEERARREAEKAERDRVNAERQRTELYTALAREADEIRALLSA